MNKVLYLFDSIADIAKHEADKRYGRSSKSYFFAWKLYEQQLIEAALAKVVKERNEKEVDEAILAIVKEKGCALGCESMIKIYPPIKEESNEISIVALDEDDEVYYFADLDEKERRFKGLSFPSLETKLKIYESIS